MPPPDDNDFLDELIQRHTLGHQQQTQLDADAQRAQAEFLRLQAAGEIILGLTPRAQEPEALTEATLEQAIVDIQRAAQNQRIQVAATHVAEQQQRAIMERWYRNEQIYGVQNTRTPPPWTNLENTYAQRQPPQTRGNQATMSKTATIPKWTRESFCDGQNRQDILIRFSDIKRLLKALHTDSKTVQVFVKTRPPVTPAIDHSVVAYNFRIKYDQVYNDELGINEITRVYYEPNIVWQKWDAWTNQWVDINEDQILSDPKKRWLAWLTKWKKWKDGTGVTSHNDVPVYDYFTFVLNSIFNKRSNAFALTDRRYQNRKFWTEYAKMMGIPDGSATLIETYNRQRSPIPNAGTVAARNEHRKYRRAAPPKNFRFPYKLGQDGYIEIIKTLYKTKYGIDWTKTIFYGANSGQVEIEDLPLDELPLIGGRRIAMRHINDGLIRKCDCCETLTTHDNSFYLNPGLPEHKGTIEYLVKLKNKDKVPVEPIKPKDTVKDVHPLFNLKASNPVTELSRQIFINTFLSADKKSNGAEGAIIIPQWNYAPAGWISPSEVKKHYIICAGCQHKNWGARPRNRLHGENELPMWGRDYIRNYTDNPIKYHPTMGAPTKSSFNVGPKENRNLREVTEPVVIDAVVEQYVDGNGNLKTRRKAVTKDIKSVKDKTLYMGVELEVTPSEALRKKIAAVLGATYTKGTGNNLGNYDVGYTSSIVETFLKTHKVGIMKSDASVHGGFEIVTVPGTLAWHKEVAWNTFFKENYENPEEAKIAPSAFLAGWSNNGELTPCSNYQYPVCGIHIHVSKDALTPLQLGKIINFVGDNKAFVTKIAGRDENRYAPFKKKKISDGSVLKYIGQGNAPRTGPIRGDLFDGTREAVNVNTSGKPTIEFRMFRSNIAKAGFFKNLEFVHALVSWCGTESSANKLDHKEFIKWVSENKEPYEHFYKWLVKNKFLNSKHKANPEFIERKVVDLETKKVTVQKFPNPGYKAELEDAA